MKSIVMHLSNHTAAIANMLDLDELDLSNKDCRENIKKMLHQKLMKRINALIKNDILFN